MKPTDKQLDDLLRAAARARRPEPGPPGFPLEARVLGQWRALETSGGGDFMLAWFRRAAIGACLLALGTLAWSYNQPGIGGDELALADSAMRIGMEP